MREIKFRGWHTVQKRMFSAEELAVDQLTLLPTGSFINVSGTSTILSELYPNDKFIPLQYTGLKDKNGKEIYEGDIVRYFEKPSHKQKTLPVNAQVIYKDAMFTLDPHPMRWNATFFSILGKSLAVIGNIYENEDLLK